MDSTAIERRNLLSGTNMMSCGDTGTKRRSRPILTEVRGEEDHDRTSGLGRLPRKQYVIGRWTVLAEDNLTMTGKTGGFTFRTSVAVEDWHRDDRGRNTAVFMAHRLEHLTRVWQRI